MSAAPKLVEVPAPKPSLAARILLAQAELRTIGKDGRNEGQGYNYVREQDVTEQARAALIKHGIVVLPSVPRVEFRAVPTKSGQSNLTDVYPVFTVINADDKEDRLDCPWYGCGADTTDKGGNKAITASLKYFLIKLLLIPTGEADPDADSEQDVTTKPKTQKDPKPADPFGAAPDATPDSATEDLTPAQAELYRVFMASAMELADKTKKKPLDVIKQYSSFDGKDGKPVWIRDPKHAVINNPKWVEGTRHKLTDALLALENTKDDVPF